MKVLVLVLVLVHEVLTQMSFSINWSRTILVLVLLSVLKKKSCSFSRLVVILDGSEQGTPYGIL